MAMMDIEQIKAANADPAKWREETGRNRKQNFDKELIAAQQAEHGRRVEARQRQALT